MSGKIYCIGDSHVSVFLGKDMLAPEFPMQQKPLLPSFEVIRLGAITAYNLCNYNSKSRGRVNLELSLENIPKKSWIIISAGEIDCRAYLIKKAKSRSNSWEEITTIVAERYTDYLYSIKKNNYNIIVLLPPPTSYISKDNPLYPKYGSEIERNMMTSTLIKAIKEKCDKYGIHSIGVFENGNTNFKTNKTFLWDGIHMSTYTLPFLINQIRKITKQKIEIPFYWYIREIIRKMKNLHFNKDYLKRLWHEFNAFKSALKIWLIGNKAEKFAIKGWLLKKKFLHEEKYIQRLLMLPIKIREGDFYRRIEINNNIYFWPQKASMESLWVVLSEALIFEHPHYYDSCPTLLATNYRVLDIGACEGSFCLAAARKVQEVVAIEPSYIMTEAMQLAAKDMELTNLKFVVGLLGSSNCKMGFQENIESPEASLIVDSKLATEYRQCWTLDTFIKDHFPNGIDYIKCDAEGADLDILKSGKHSLIKYKPKIAVASYHSQDDFRKIQEFLESINYTVQGQGLFYSAVLHKCYPMLLKAY